MEHESFELVSLAWFGGWLAALGVLFWGGLELPLGLPGRGARHVLYAGAVIVAALVVAVLANVAVSFHDAHLDLTREKVFTPSAPALEVVDRLRTRVSLTYFYQGTDPNGLRARDIVEVMGRRNPRLAVRTIDPDRRPSLAETAGVKVYNAALLEADGRRVLVRSTDETEIAIGIQRVLRERVITVCFIEGHNEYPSENYEFHTHLEGATGHSHDDGSSKLVQMNGHGIGRLRRSLEALGYDVKKIPPPTAGVPRECTLVIDAGPRTTYVPAESAALQAYLADGGSALLLYDLGFVLEPGLAALIKQLGVALPQSVVIDPKSHYGTDPQLVAVTGYDPMPITRNVSYTFYPGVRPLELSAPAAGVQTAPLVKSSGDSELHAVVAVEQRAVAPEAPAATPTAAGPHVLAAASQGTLPGAAKPFRAVVAGDADFASNSFYPYMANSDLALAMVRWLVHEDQTTAIASRIPVPPLVLLTQPQMKLVFGLLVILLPLATAAIGVLVWWQRR
ncbi:MAG: Gldg family protein [Gammaproteobacteria bacterium]|nr:Gldg family protein [Gammaproteobacteria bacterium]